MRFIVFSVGCQYGCIVRRQQRASKTRVLMAPAEKALRLSGIRAADGIKAAKLTKQ